MLMFIYVVKIIMGALRFSQYANVSSSLAQFSSESYSIQCSNVITTPA